MIRLDSKLKEKWENKIEWKTSQSVMVKLTVLIKDFPQEKLLVKSFRLVMGDLHLNLKKKAIIYHNFAPQKYIFV
jgi:hypothetical protein